MKKILYGHDEEENIVSIEPLEKQNKVQIFTREGDEVRSRYEPYKYLVYFTDGEPLLDKYENLNVKKLFGTNHYNRLLKTNDYETYLDFKYNADDSHAPYERSQYMLQTGKTQMMGMELNDPLILYFDIETLTKEGFDFSNADREEDEIFIIALRTNRGDEWVFYHGEAKPEREGVKFTECKTEKELLVRFVALLRKIDPDIIANHNIFNFDLSYLKTRCALHGISFAIGRNGSEPVTFETTIKFADRNRTYTNFNVYGRHVIDTQFLAEYADVTSRDMPSYRLKDLVKYLGKEQEERTYIPGEDIALVWRQEHTFYSREDLLNYAVDDVREAEVLYNEYAEAYFKLTPMIPMGFQDVFRYGTGNEVEYVFMREYLRQRWSYPKNKETGKVPGGYAAVLSWGVFKGEIVYADVKSLYPTLAKTLKIKPRTDELEIFQEILNLLINFRYEIKAKIKGFKDKGDEESAKKQKALDASIKIFLNTMAYGFIASPWNAFADYKEASRITLGGQAKAKEIIGLVEADGGTAIKWDTDGGAIILPDEYKGKPDEYCQYLTDRLEEEIIVENDGVFKGIIPFGGKSYALLEEDGIKLKGGSLIGRDIEEFGRKYIKQCIELLFEYRLDTAKKKCAELYKELKEKIEKRDLDADDIYSRKNLGMSPEEYKNRNEAGETPTTAQYELALRADKDYGEGDVVKFYIKEFPYIIKEIYGKPELRKKKCANYEAAELIENYNYDFEPEHYTSRLDNITMLFTVLGEDYFYDVYPDVKVYAKDRKNYNKKTGKVWTPKNL